LEAFVTDGGASVIEALANANAAEKQGLYEDLGLSLTYHQATQVIDVRLEPGLSWANRACPRGDLNPHALSGTSTSS